MKRKNVSLVLFSLLTLVFAVLITACNSTAKAPTDTEGGTSDSQADSYYPVTITTYNYGHEPIEVTFEKAPTRVVCGYQSCIEIMLALGLEANVCYAFGLDGDVAQAYAAAFAKMEYAAERPAKEEVIALEPDLILSWYSLFAEDRLGDVDYWIANGTNTYMWLNSAAMGDPEEHPYTVAQEMQSIMDIGRIFNKVDEAQAIVDEMQEEIDKVSDHLSASDRESQAIAVLEADGTGAAFRVYGANTVAGDMVSKLGGTLGVGGENSNDIGAENLIALDPDVIMMVWYEGGPYSEEQAISPLMDNPVYANLSAVKNNKVYALNLSHIYCSGLHTLDGIKTFGKALYPELYGK